MHAEILVRMVNQIAEFYAAASEPEVAARETLSHVQRMWAHRMCRQMIEIGPNDPGLSPVAKRTVQLLAESAAAKQAAG